MQETKRHGDAFDYYYALGAERSYTKVASKFNISRTSLSKWGRAFNWKTRIAQRDIENNKKGEAKTNRAVVNTKADYRSDIREDRKELREIEKRIAGMVKEATGRKKNSKLKAVTIKGLNDLITSLVKIKTLEKEIVKLDLALIGESGEQESIEITVKLPEGITLDDV